MVGTTSSGNRNPKNNIVINASGELLDYIRSLKNPKGLPLFQIVARDFLKVHKKKFIEMHGQEIFDEHMKKFNRNISEMKKDKLKRDREKQKERKEREAREDRKLELEERKIRVSESNTGIRQNKIEDKELQKQVEYEELLRKLEKYKTNLEKSRGTKYEGNWEEKVAKVESEIKALGYEIPDDESVRPTLEPEKSKDVKTKEPSLPLQP